MITRMILDMVSCVPMRALLPLGLVLAAALAGCGGDGGSAGGSVRVGAPTPLAAARARNVGGDRVEVDAIVAPNADPHEFEPRPGDVKAVADAEIVVRSGGDLDDWLGDLLESAGGDPTTVTLLDRVKPLAGDDEVDPHWWQDPRNALLAAAAIRDTLAKADPEGRARYEANAAAYLRRLRALDGAVARCVEQIPEAQRKLVTTHDALGYYARRYGLEVIGTVIPANTTQAQPSAGDTARLIDTIRRAKVRAIFAESSVEPKVEKAIARATGAVIGRPLWADGLGPAGSGGDTYLRAVAENTRAITEGLTGRACELPA